MSIATFYNSRNGDRKYNADDITRWLTPFFTTGVFNNDLRVVANDNMTVSVQVGYVNIGGKTKYFDEVITLDVPKASGTLNRIDSIIVQRNDTEREFFIKLVEGGLSSTNPQPTELVRDAAIYELRLAEINVSAGTIKVTQDLITDKRMDDTVCGWVVATVKEVDFAQITAQFDTFFSYYEGNIEDEYQKYLDSMAENEVSAWDKFERWFDQVKGQLSTDQAGHLQQNKIDLLEVEDIELVDRLNKVFYLEKGTEHEATEIVKVRFQDENGRDFYIKTSADQVVFDDDTTLEDKLGSIKDIITVAADLDTLEEPGSIIDALIAKQFKKDISGLNTAIADRKAYMLESGWVSRYEVVIPAGSAMIAVVSVYNRTNVYLIHSMSNEILITTLISNTTDIALVPYQEARYIAFRHQDSSTTIRVEAWSGYATVKKR